MNKLKAVPGSILEGLFTNGWIALRKFSQSRKSVLLSIRQTVVNLFVVVVVAPFQMYFNVQSDKITSLTLASVDT